MDTVHWVLHSLSLLSQQCIALGEHIIVLPQICSRLHSCCPVCLQLVIASRAKAEHFQQSLSLSHHVLTQAKLVLQLLHLGCGLCLLCFPALPLNSQRLHGLRVVLLNRCKLLPLSLQASQQLL